MTRAQAQRLSDYLAHMVDAISRIQRYVDGMTEQSLQTMHQDLLELRQQIEQLQRGLHAA